MFRQSVTVLALVAALASAAPQRQRFRNNFSINSDSFTSDSFPSDSLSSQPGQLQFSSQPQFVSQPRTSSRSNIIQPPANVLSSSNFRTGDGGYTYSYSIDNGIAQEQNAEPKVVRNDENEDILINVVKGSYSYVGDDGNTYTVEYVADQNGYRASGAHLPLPPLPIV